MVKNGNDGQTLQPHVLEGTALSGSDSCLPSHFSRSAKGIQQSLDSAQQLRVNSVAQNDAEIGETLLGWQQSDRTVSYEWVTTRQAHMAIPKT